jgi:Uma2 family endonuclease
VGVVGAAAPARTAGGLGDAGHNKAVWWLVGALFEVATRNGWDLLQTTVLLVAEVVSPSSRHDDREVKRDAYARGRAPLYLLIDPQQSERSVTLFSDPHPDGYRSRTRVPFGDQIGLPEPLRIVLDTAGMVT